MKVIDSNLFLLPGNKHMLHLATVQDGMHEYVAMVDRRTGKCYIEEVVLESKNFSKDIWANFKFIQEDHIAEELNKFLVDKGVIDQKKIAQILLDQNKLGLLL